jgi:chromosome segregation ATPase
LVDDKNELKKEVVTLTSAIKSAEKELKDSKLNFKKESQKLENKVEDLSEYKQQKLSEEKDLKTKQKKGDKRLKMIQEKEAQLKVEKNKLERDKIEALETDNNQNVKNEENTKVNDSSIAIQTLSEHDPQSCLGAASIKTSCYMADITTNPSMVTHWLPSSPVVSSETIHKMKLLMETLKSMFQVS